MIVELVGGPGDGTVLDMPDRPMIVYEVVLPREDIFAQLYEEYLRRGEVAPVSPPQEQVIYRWAGRRRPDGTALFQYVP